jgi:membrane protein insertase Oxa1/YidC/SpoIIIJ
MSMMEKLRLAVLVYSIIKDLVTICYRSFMKKRIERKQKAGKKQKRRSHKRRKS